MKFILLSLWLLLTLSVNGQRIKGIEISPERKAELLKDLVTSKTAAFEMYSKEDIEGNFFPFHLNNDDKVDFIYNGFVGAESSGVEIYIAKNDGQFELIKSELGIVDKVIRKLPDSPTEIHFIQYGCCEEPLNFFQIWSISGNKVTESEKYFYFRRTEIPENFNFQFGIEVLNTPYTLRATPEIISEEFHYHYERGNIIAEFSKGDTGYVLDSKTDNTGRVWYFVIMNPPKEKGFHSYDTYRNEKWMGWMSSRYVERKE